MSLEDGVLSVKGNTEVDSEGNKVERLRKEKEKEKRHRYCRPRRCPHRGPRRCPHRGLAPGPQAQRGQGEAGRDTDRLARYLPALVAVDDRRVGDRGNDGEWRPARRGAQDAGERQNPGPGPEAADPRERLARAARRSGCIRALAVVFITHSSSVGISIVIGFAYLWFMEVICGQIS